MALLIIPIVLFAAGIVFALIVRRRISPLGIWSFTILTFVLLIAIIYVWSRPITSEAAVYVYAEILVYLILPFAFTLPVTLIFWVMSLKNRLALQKKGA